MSEEKTETTQETPVEKTQADREAFIKEYGELVTKHGFDFASYPVWVPDGSGGFKTMIQSTPVDISKQPQKSPFVAKEE